MGLAGGNRPHPRAIIFDLDRCLIDSRAAWRYCVEEAIALTSGRRMSAVDLVEEFHVRPWSHALSILLDAPEQLARCCELCESMMERSAMKKLLVHEGIGMALDALRGERIELGAISRLPHRLAVKRVQSTGLDRFVAVLSATPEGEAWAPDLRVQHCLAFLEAEGRNCAFISGEPRDREALAALGLAAFAAEWAAGGDDAPGAIRSPSQMLEVVLRSWRGVR